MTTRAVELNRSNVHGHFSRDLDPIITIDSGDAVVFQTLDGGWRTEPDSSTGQWDRETHYFERDPKLDTGHALCGPVAIRGAQPGMTLEIAIRDLAPGPWGWTLGGGDWSQLNKRLGVGDGAAQELRWILDRDTMTGREQHSRTVDLRPFMGVMGMPPNEPGIQSTAPPRPCGGNIDCKELVAGSVLYLPISVEGALFSVGDGHAAQGDGEVSGLAIECPMDRVELAFTLHPDLVLTTPRARTKTGWITFGFHEDLYEATIIALNAMLDLMQSELSIERKDALALASIVVDLRITQIVNGFVESTHPSPTEP